MTRRINSAALIRQSLRLATLSLLLLTLGGCSLLDSRPAPISSVNSYEKDVLYSALLALEDWHIIGKIGVRTPEQSLSAAINSWEQHGDIYDIQLSSTFFGLGQSRLMGSNGFLMIQESGEDPVSSDHPEQLLQQALGFPLPISALIYWVKGVAYPNTTAIEEYSDKGLIKRLEQNDWTLEFDQFFTPETVNLPLPGRIRMTQGGARITLVIKEWAKL